MDMSLINAQNKIKNMLINAYHNKRLNHAYIFNGAEGVGTNEMAYFFACMLYCENVCLKCETCKQIMDDDFINLYIVKPVNNIIKKEQIASLQKEFTKTSLVDGPRIYIIENADKMNASSANSLLKFIEEPTSNETYAILLTTDATNLLPTIISRCAMINFYGTNKEVIKDKLLENNIDIKYSNILISFNNNANEILNLYQNEKIIKIIDLFYQFIDIIKVEDSIKFLNKNMNTFDDFDNLNYFLEILIIYYEDILSNSDDISLNNILEKIINIRETNSRDILISYLRLVLELKKKLNANVSCKNIITNLFINMF